MPLSPVNKNVSSSVKELNRKVLLRKTKKVNAAELEKENTPVKSVERTPLKPYVNGVFNTPKCADEKAGLGLVKKTPSKCTSCSELRKALKDLEASSKESEAALHKIIKDLNIAVTNSVENGKAFEESYKSLHSEGTELYRAYEKKCLTIKDLMKELVNMEGIHKEKVS